MRLFLDTSVLLAASGSERGASRAVLERATAAGWVLVVTPYVLEETLSNLSFIGGAFYDLLVLTPGMFLQREVAAGRLVL